MSILKNKPPLAAASIALPAEDMKLQARTTGPEFDSWWLLIIGFNLPVFIHGVTMLLHFHDFAAFMLFGPLVITPAWNIRTVLLLRRDKNAKIRWRPLLIAGNVFVGIYGLCLMASAPTHIMPIGMIVAGLAGIRLALSASTKGPDDPRPA